MFPTPFPKGDDPNRRDREKLPEDGTWPQPLRLAYVTSVVAAILMLVTAAIMFTRGFTGGEDAPQEVVDAFLMNQRIVAVGNVIAAIGLALTAPQLRHGAKISRRWMSGFTILGIAANLLGFVVTVSGLMAIIIVAFLAFSAMFAFRPVSNRYIRERDELRKNSGS